MVRVRRRALQHTYIIQLHAFDFSSPLGVGRGAPPGGPQSKSEEKYRKGSRYPFYNPSSFTPFKIHPFT